MLAWATATLIAASTGVPAGPTTTPPATAIVDPQTTATTPQPAAVEGSHAADQRDIVVTARHASEAPDPLAAVNLQSFVATEAVEKALIAPIALAYKRTVPSPFRSGVHNFLYNMREPVVFVNYAAQHKIGKAAETFARFAVNTTIGVAGVFDRARRRPFRLPRRGNGFADTLGFYGIPSGPFMFLPIVGPTTVRDLLGGAVDRLVLPLTFGSRITHPSFVVPVAVLGVLDHRAEFDETLHELHDGVENPYANTRAYYLERRQAEIDHLRGRKSGSSSPMSERPKGPINLPGVKLSPAPKP